MRKVFIFLSSLLVTISLSAQRPHHHPNEHEHHHRPHMEQKYIECASPEQMQIVMQTLKNQSFDDKRLEVAKLCVTIGYFCTSDLAQIATSFSFDDKRLEFYKYAYPYCLDKENYPMLKSSFSFSSNYDELMEYIYPGYKR